jgi:hypothetical protein
VHQWGILNAGCERQEDMSKDQSGAEQRKQAKQWVFWTAVVLALGYIIFIVL